MIKLFLVVIKAPTFKLPKYCYFIKKNIFFQIIEEIFSDSQTIKIFEVATCRLQINRVIKLYQLAKIFIWWNTLQKNIMLSRKKYHDSKVFTANEKETKSWEYLFTEKLTDKQKNLSWFNPFLNVEDWYKKLNKSECCVAFF